MNHSQFSNLKSKEKDLQEIIRSLASDRHVVVAFSGGVDSSLLLLETVQALGPENVLAITACSPTSVPDELQETRDLAHALDVRLVVTETRECEDPLFMANPVNRCYHCKKIRYQAIRNLAEVDSNAVIFDGTNADDDPADRPGFAALSELAINTPLRDANLTKEDIRGLLKSAGYHKIATKFPQPCLATRIPYGAPITTETLDRIRAGEIVLKKLGFGLFRLRTHNDWAKIVLDADGFQKIASDNTIRKTISHELKKIGYKTVTLDLDEYGAGAIQP
ncbi:MAG: ATP-dependent sacrificial sulfur transferase LarE [Desulfomonilaceae bacterium]